MEEVSLYKNNQDLCPCSHESKYLNEMSQNLVICFNCSSIIYTNESEKKFFRLNQENIIHLKKHQPRFFYQ